MNNNSNNINTGDLCRFGYKRIYLFPLSVVGDTRRETQIINAYVEHTI